jgi:hypothetical protein
LITNYRPLTLGNGDYKLIAKVFAIRLAKCIHEIVSSQQTGFIPKRNIRGNIMEAHLILKRMHRAGTCAAMLLLDFEKAYDRVDREFLFAVLAHLNCGPNFILAIVILHANSTIIIQINDDVTEPITV